MSIPLGRLWEKLKVKKVKVEKSIPTIAPGNRDGGWPYYNKVATRLDMSVFKV
jgi:hypothetical protein